MNKDYELYGEERLRQVLEHKEHNYKVSQVTDAILEGVAQFTKGAEQSDDITILVISYD